jgi:hypothetical protein
MTTGQCSRTLTKEHGGHTLAVTVQCLLVADFFQTPNSVFVEGFDYIPL